VKLTNLQLSRTIAATPGEIYDVWLDHKSPGGPWFGAARVILNPAVDGLFYHCVKHEGREWAHYGRFIRLDRGRVIEHTWVSEATKGVETVITVTLEPRRAETLVTLTHANVPDDPMGRQHEEGWGFVLGSIAQRFGGAR